MGVRGLNWKFIGKSFWKRFWNRVFLKMIVEVPKKFIIMLQESFGDWTG